MIYDVNLLLFLCIVQHFYHFIFPYSGIKIPSFHLSKYTSNIYSNYSNLHERDAWGFFMVVEHVNGKKKGNIMLYALSTCGWCARTKELLRTLGVEFNYIYVDLLEGKEQDDMMNEVERWNLKGSFPTLVIKDKTSIIGFREDEIREGLK